MDFVVEFYKGLDTINLIIFWGVIIVVLLLLIFAIIINNKNKKLERIIEENGIDIGNYDDDDLAIKKETNVNITKEENTTTNINYIEKENDNKQITNDSEITIKNEKTEKKFIPLIINEKETKDIETPTVKMPEIEEPVKEEKFVVEEHVMEYRNNSFELPNIKKNSFDDIATNKENAQPNAPYERNVLREMSSNQTSPIGIAIRHTNSEKEIARAKELHNALNEQEMINNQTKNFTNDEYLINQKRYANTYKEPARKGDYLEELSKKLSNASSSNDINRTEYELKQEEDAIISYQELLEKKDSIKTVDEEEAVISIDELRTKKAQEEKLYNLTKEEENDDFIKELKHFRSDL